MGGRFLYARGLPRRLVAFAEYAFTGIPAPVARAAIRGNVCACAGELAVGLRGARKRQSTPWSTGGKGSLPLCLDSLAMPRRECGLDVGADLPAGGGSRLLPDLSKGDLGTPGIAVDGRTASRAFLFFSLSFVPSVTGSFIYMSPFCSVGLANLAVQQRDIRGCTSMYHGRF